jgi:curved DNA-binding protein CbpA
MAKAYREAALRHHPDRGGSHKQMAMVNEAWFILSNPETRCAYDKLRTQRMDAAARAGWNRRTEDVRRKAQEYPRQWSAFERWMKGIVDDIRAAEYGKVQGGGVAWPTAGKSSSGWGFIVVGGLVGGVLGCVAFVASGSHAVGMLRFYLIFAAAGGAWVGAKVHGFLRKTMGGGHATDTKAGTRPAARQDEYGRGQGAVLHPQVSEAIQHEMVRCPKCSQPLRVPSLDKEITITCPKCKNKFTHKAHT